MSTVGQDNFFHPFLTVRETVSHFARLQYPHLDEGDLSEKVNKSEGGNRGMKKAIT
jgi:ABC-type multidrug transport system ATPase subunit